MNLDRAKEILLDHARHPRRQGEIENCDASGECRNPICGDHVRVTLKFDIAGNKIEDVRILTSGCVISNASASLMTELLIGRTRAGLVDFIAKVTSTLSSTQDQEWPNSLEMLTPFASLRTNPRKIPCALIAWYALKNSIPSDELRPLSKAATTV